MHLVDAIVFRKLTDTDFFNINKPKRTEQRGGGQSYIDFPTSAISVENWKSFFKNIEPSSGKNGPIWKFKINSLGVKKDSQEITIAQRRPATVSIRSQKLDSAQGNRVYAWRPNLTGFPKPNNPQNRSHIYNLYTYIVKLDNDEYWAGWFHTNRPERSWSINETLNMMFTENEGYLQFDKDVIFDFADDVWPFRIIEYRSEIIPTVTNRGETIKEKIFFDEDEISSQNMSSKTKESIRTIRIRNFKAVKKLKALYDNQCQVSGKKYAFKKINGKYYSEAHHLIPLGKGGADSAYNMVILSPLIHRMMHYAKIDGFDLKNIKNNKLSIKINNIRHTITWHPDHAKIVKEYSA